MTSSESPPTSIKQLPTVSTISQPAGFSASTVSRALKGDSRIPDKTREAILAIANEQGYTPTATRGAW